MWGRVFTQTVLQIAELCFRKTEPRALIEGFQVDKAAQHVCMGVEARSWRVNSHATFQYLWQYIWPVESFVREGGAVVLLVEFLSFMKCRLVGYTQDDRFYRLSNTLGGYSTALKQIHTEFCGSFTLEGRLRNASRPRQPPKSRT